MANLGGHALAALSTLNTDVMPMSPLRPCARQPCPALVASGCCEAHGGPRKPWERKAPPPARLRGRDGMARRRRVLSRQPTCVLCTEAGRLGWSTVADHIIPLAEGGVDSESNLQGLCEPCHRAKTADEARRGRIRRR